MLVAEARPGVEDRPPVEARGVTAHVHATFNCVRSQTQLLTSTHAAPLKIAKVFPVADGSVDVCVMDCSPGLLNGDRYELDWRVEENARVKTTTQSFTKCTLRLVLAAVRARASKSRRAPFWTIRPNQQCFFVMPNSTPSAMHTSVLAALYCSAISCVRAVSGEVRCLLFATIVTVFGCATSDELIFCNQMRFQPQQQNLRAIGAWGDNTHYGTFSVFSSSVDLHLLRLCAR
jgi:urease accessory protein